MGAAALPSIYRLAHDPQRRAHAEDIFHLIPVELIASGLLARFASSDRGEEEMAFSLLAMGVDDEYSLQPRSASLTSALLAQTLDHAPSGARLRALCALLFFSKEKRSAMAQRIVGLTTRAAEASVSTEYLHILSLLGSEAADPLGLAVHTPTIPEAVRLEMIGLLGTLAEDEQVTAFVNTLAAGTDGTSNAHRAWGLRALGGLLASGRYSEQKLEAIREGLRASSKAQDRAAFEFFDILLGKRNLPEVVRLREAIDKQQQHIDQLNQRIRQQEDELARIRQRAELAETRTLRLPRPLNKR
jgi:hypothetical protein